MAKTAHLPEARTRYVLQGMSPEEIAAELPVSAATVRRWLTQAKANGDDWDKARSTTLLSTGGVDAVNHAMLQLLSSTILRAQALLTTAMESDNPADTIKLIEVIRGLSDAHIKTINATQRGSPEINRAAMIQDFALALDAFILREFPDDIRVFRRIIPDFGRELMRVYGTATVILNNKMWESARFRAIIRWPDHLDLWETWERIFKQEGEEAALFFYRANRARMDAGAEVSWPEVRPLQALMIIRARNGRNAFDSEMQNEPLSENAIFTDLSFWNEPKKRWIYFGAVDPSLGKSGGRGDPSAILVAGLDRETGILDVVEADIRIRKPDRIIRDVIDLQKKYQCRLWAVEAIQFQEFFKDELVKQSAAQGVPVPAESVNPSSDKELRITSLQPHIANGLIRFHQSQSTLIE
ncbi:phage terminase large subunit, partial [Candidatus Magnetaquicoccus inordinatus]|uniref:phage terminase large subunit n=1 Tax=Candidatus Magnetaquicoccus inordinatus TaxID=2496818 RepID=UPI00102B17A2